jgi:hypothetical protein
MAKAEVVVNPATVYVVDDDDAMRRALSLLLNTVGYKTAAFASPKEFLDAFKPDTAGCLVLDIRMPGMSGLELQQLGAPRRRSAPHRVPDSPGETSDGIGGGWRRQQSHCHRFGIERTDRGNSPCQSHGENGRSVGGTLGETAYELIQRDLNEPQWLTGIHVYIRSRDEPILALSFQSDSAHEFADDFDFPPYA